MYKRSLSKIGASEKNDTDSILESCFTGKYQNKRESLFKPMKDFENISIIEKDQEEEEKVISFSREQVSPKIKISTFNEEVKGEESRRLSIKGEMQQISEEDEKKAESSYFGSPLIPQNKGSEFTFEINPIPTKKENTTSKSISTESHDENNKEKDLELNKASTGHFRIEVSSPDEED